MSRDLYAFSDTAAVNWGLFKKQTKIKLNEFRNSEVETFKFFLVHYHAISAQRAFWIFFFLAREKGEGRNQ